MAVLCAALGYALSVIAVAHIGGLCATGLGPGHPIAVAAYYFSVALGR
jgi:hypothetical protein